MQRIFVVLICIAAMACSTSEPVHDNAPATLAGTSWTAVSIDGVAVAPGSTVTADFGDNGELTGTTGCNRYLATYEVEESSLRIDLSGASKRLCSEPAGVMEQEALFLRLLGSVTDFRSTGEELDLGKDGGGTAMTLRLSKQGE